MRIHILQSQESQIIRLVNYQASDRLLLILTDLLRRISGRKKTPNSNITTSVDTLSSLSFNNLTIGKTYRVTINSSPRFTTAAGSNQASILLTNSGVEVARNKAYQNGTTGAETFYESGTTYIFEAVDSSLLTEIVIQGSAYLQASGTNIYLEEINNYEETTDFT